MKLLFFVLIVFCTATASFAGMVNLADIGLDKIRQDWGKPTADHSVDGHPLTVGGKVFDHGVGTHALSVWWIDLSCSAQRLTASVGMDDEVKPSRGAARTTVEFQVIGDHKTLYKSGPVRLGAAAKSVDVDLTGVKTLVLVVLPASRSIDFAHADWADAVITYTGRRPTSINAPDEPAQVLTPTPPSEPRINGAMILGVRPGHPVLYQIAATGNRPMAYAADGLPDGLSLDPDSGRITGAAAQVGESVVKLKAINAAGSAQRTLRIEVGPTIALTPPMGWNSWNCFAQSVSDQKVRAAADAMVKSGLIQHGWTYINIDDCWEVRPSEPADHRRASDGHILTNQKFPDMKALADYIHSQGLRCGLYSSPGPSTCGGFTASYQFETQDARQYADWGFDYLKYDWCSYGQIADQITRGPNPPSPLEVLQAPYRLMRDALLKQNRDILFSFCQYGRGNVWEWAEKTGGNCWRTTDDISDNWSSMSGIGFAQTGHEQFAGPGHWNDPDMLVVGKVGWGPALHPTRLTPNEQYTHISLWCLLSAPLLIGCDMTQMDDFTMGLLTNDEVLAVDQDPLGQQASRTYFDDEGQEVWARSLSDGTKAVGLFNRSEMPSTVTCKWSDLGLNGKQPARDLWRQKDLGEFDGQFGAEVPRHGVVLIKVGRPTSRPD
jgi:alpha-galactosidase